MIKVTFTDGTEKNYDADTWNFRNVNENNVYLKKIEKVVAHINWNYVKDIEYQPSEKDVSK